MENPGYDADVDNNRPVSMYPYNDEPVEYVNAASTTMPSPICEEETKTTSPAQQPMPPYPYPTQQAPPQVYPRAQSPPAYNYPAPTQFQPQAPYGYGQQPGQAPMMYNNNQQPQPQMMPNQQQQVVFVNASNNQTPAFVPAAPLPSYIGHIVFACCVFWCCNLLFGLVAFILASK